MLIAQQSKYILDTTRNGDPMLFGTVTAKEFQQAPFSEWFVKNTDQYVVDQETMHRKKLIKALNKHDITIYMGTWCGDSRKEVPIVLKSLEDAGYDMSRLDIIALNQLKQGQNREELGMNIHRVPTIIFSKNGKEKGRIVEHPLGTIEQDIMHVLTANKYRPNYYGLEVVHQAVTKKGLEALDTDQLFSKAKSLIQKDYELSKYGMIHFRNGAFDKALAIYDFNAKLFPSSDRPYVSKGISYYLMGDLVQSKVQLEKALHINPENKYARRYLELIAEAGGEAVASRE
jgi:hypothetical protein